MLPAQEGQLSSSQRTPGRCGIRAPHFEHTQKPSGPSPRRRLASVIGSPPRPQVGTSAVADSDDTTLVEEILHNGPANSRAGEVLAGIGLGHGVDGNDAEQAFGKISRCRERVLELRSIGCRSPGRARAPLNETRTSPSIIGFDRVRGGAARNRPSASGTSPTSVVVVVMAWLYIGIHMPIACLCSEPESSAGRPDRPGAVSRSSPNCRASGARARGRARCFR